MEAETLKIPNISLKCGINILAQEYGECFISVGQKEETSL